MAVTGSLPLGLQVPSFLQSPQHLARCSCLGSYQQTVLYHTSGHVINLSVSAIGWSSRDFKPSPTGTSDLLTSPQTVLKPIKNYTCTSLVLQWRFLGAQWLSGRLVDSRPKGRGFEPHRRHCVVVIEQDTFIVGPNKHRLGTYIQVNVYNGNKLSWLNGG